MSNGIFGGEGGTRIKLLLRKILLICSALACYKNNRNNKKHLVASFTLANLSG